MKKQQKSGSILLTVLILINIITLMVVATLKNTMLVADYCHHYTQAQAANLLANGLRTYAIEVAKTNYLYLIQQKSPLDISLLLPDGQGAIQFENQDNGLMIKTWLHKENTRHGLCACKLSKNSQQQFVIQGFQGS